MSFLFVCFWSSWSFPSCRIVLSFWTSTISKMRSLWDVLWTSGWCGCGRFRSTFRIWRWECSHIVHGFVWMFLSSGVSSGLSLDLVSRDSPALHSPPVSLSLFRDDTRGGVSRVTYGSPLDFVGQSQSWLFLGDLKKGIYCLPQWGCG